MLEMKITPYFKYLLYLFMFSILLIVLYKLNFTQERTVLGSIKQAIADTDTLPEVRNLLRLLQKLQNGSYSNVKASDIKKGVEFLLSLKTKFENDDSSSSYNSEDYFQTNEEWHTSKSDWKEKFYPAANYTGEVCGEILVRTKDTYPEWPYFKLKDSCVNQSSITVSKLVSIVLNFVSYTSNQLRTISRVLDGIYVVYPKIKVIMSVPTGHPIEANSNVDIVHTPKNGNPGQIWNNLIKKVDTKYVLIGRNMLHFDIDSQLERLIREIPSIKLPIISGSIKTPSDGHWFNGCQQMAHRNYTLVYKSGYKHSAHDCLYCHSVLGPFVAKTEFMKENLFHETMPESILFYDYFYKLFKKKIKVGVCPDVMFQVQDDAVASLNRSQWLPFVASNSFNKLATPDGNIFTYTCKESNIDGKLRKGFTTAPCKLQKLANHIKFVMRICREHNIICELNAGTTLGALKLNSVLPWEKDADILYHYENSSAVDNLRKYFKQAGYSLNRAGKGTIMDANVFYSYGSGWKVDFYPFPELASTKLRHKGENPTKVLLDGDWVEVTTNVGQQIRNRYGPEIYKHVQHSSELNKEQFTVRTGYKWAGHFTRCPNPGAHNCLDQFEADGNLQFIDPVP